MRMGIKLVFASALVARVIAGQGLIAQFPFDQPGPSTLAFGAVDGNNLLVTQTAGDEVQWYWADLARGSLVPLVKAMPMTAKGLRFGPHGGAIGSPAKAKLVHRWRLACGYFWGTRADGILTGDFYCAELQRMAFPVEDLAGKMYKPATGSARGAGDDADGSNKSSALSAAEAQRRHVFGVGPPHLVIAGSPESFFDGGDVYYDTVIAPVASMRFVKYEALRGLDAADARARYANFHFECDVLPVAPQRVLAFVLVNSTVTVWEFPFEKFVVRGKPDAWSGQWRRKGTFPAPLTEPFHVAAAERAYFFVTDSGAVYMAEETDGKLQTSVIWKDAARPVLTMLAESDGATAFVFGKDFYLKLGKKPKPVSCRDVTKGTADLTERARMAYECGRVLFEKGELKTAAASKGSNTVRPKN